MSQPIPTDVRPGLIESPLVKELRLHIISLQEIVTGLRTDAELLRDAGVLLQDANSDLQKENRGLRLELQTVRQDLKNAEHDRDECHRELNRRGV